MAPGSTSAKIDWVLWYSLLELRQELPGVATDFRVPFEKPSRRGIEHAAIKKLEVRVEQVEIEIAEPSDVPNAFAIPATLAQTTADAKRALRQALGLPVDCRVLLCAAAINRYHKRIDYLIRELARLADPSLVLLLVGQFEAETPAVLAAGRAALGARMIVGSAEPSAMEAYYRAADAFVLPSLVEAFGRVIAEAMSFGLTVIVHNGASFQETAGCHGVYVDLQRPGALAQELASAEIWQQDAKTMAARHRWSYERYSWDRLTERYLEMLATCLDR